MHVLDDRAGIPHELPGCFGNERRAVIAAGRGRRIDVGEQGLIDRNVDAPDATG